MVFLDTNLLVYMVAETSPFHDAARTLYQQVITGRLEACISPQVLCEFLAACTNEKRIHPVLGIEHAVRESLVFWQAQSLQKIFPHTTTMERALALIRRYHVSRQQVFDAFLAATMLDNGIKTIYTLNTKDFLVFHELQAIHPFERHTAKTS